MRYFLIVLFIWVFTPNIYSQIEKVSTIQIEKTLKEKGIDSAMKYFSYWPHTPIYTIDSLLYVQIVNHINNYSSKYCYFLLDGVNNIRNDFLSGKTFHIFKEHCLNIKNVATNSHYGKIITIDDAYLAVLVKQNNDSIEDFLKKEYEFWERAVREAQKVFPIKRFFKIFIGKDLVERSHYNCLILMLGLKSLDSPYYSSSAENYHRKNVRKWSQNIPLGRYIYRYEYREYGDTILNLKNQYNSLEDIDIENETGLVKFFIGNACWRTLIYSDKKGILDLGCRVGRDGRGNRFKIELIEKNKLKIIVLSTWVA